MAPLSSRDRRHRLFYPQFRGPDRNFHFGCRGPHLRAGPVSSWQMNLKTVLVDIPPTLMKQPNNMFDLDHAIAEWRSQMRTAGIKTSVPMDELENHLRDDVQQQMQSGASAEDAFGAAAR